jgi:hypothetical protein
MLSRYLEGEVAQPERRALEQHLRACEACRGHLASLTGTLQALRSMRVRARPGLADSVIARLGASDLTPDATALVASQPPAPPTLTVVPDVGQETATAAIVGPHARSQGRRALRALAAYCLRRPQLRLTLPLGLSVGIALSLINRGYMIFGGRVDVEMCAVCALDFVIPFIALNVGVVVATRVTGRRRP